MSEIQIENIQVGAAPSDANYQLFRVPTAEGGITLLKAWLVGGGAGTTGALQLNNLGTSLGTATVSTVGTMAATSGTLVAGVPVAITISTAYQAAGTWLAVKVATATPTVSNVIIEYKFGK